MSTQRSDGGSNPSGGVEYRCPYCEETYPHEVLVRVHVTRCDDEDHKNRQGLMPETVIEAVHEDGEVTEIKKRPEEVELYELGLDDFPDDIRLEAKHILLVAAHNPYEDSYTNLHNRVNESLKNADLNPVSYDTVRRVVRRYYMPQVVRKEEKKKQAKERSKQQQKDEQLSDLGPKAQAIVIATLANPSEDNTEIAERAGGASPSYPKQVYTKHSEVLNRLQSKVSNGMDVREIVLNELAEDDISELQANGLLEDLGVELLDQEDEQSTAFDFGTESGGGLSANPHVQDDQSQISTSEEQSPFEDVESDKGAGDDGWGADMPQSQSGQPQGASSFPESGPFQPIDSSNIPIRELELLQEKVEFMIEVSSKQADLGGEELDMALSLKILDEIEELMEKYGDE